MLNKILSKLTIKEYAIFFDEKGKQRDIITLQSKDTFSYDNKMFFKNRDKYNHITFLKGFKYIIYYLYDTRYSEPLTITADHLFKTPTGDPFIASHIQTVFEGKVLAEVNRKTNPLFGMDTKKLMIIGVVVVAIIYFLSGGSLN